MYLVIYFVLCPVEGVIENLDIVQLASSSMARNNSFSFTDFRAVYFRFFRVQGLASPTGGPAGAKNAQVVGYHLLGERYKIYFLKRR